MKLITFTISFLASLAIFKTGGGDLGRFGTLYFSLMLSFAFMIVFYIIKNELRKAWRSYMINQTDELD
jgi:hypothetical protein